MNPILYMLSVAGFIFLLAFITETIVEYTVGVWFDKFAKLTPHKWTLQYIAIVAGLVLGLYYRVDLISALAKIGFILQGITEYPSWAESSTAGVIMTGLLIGGGSNRVHQLVSRFLSKPFNQ